MTQEANLNTFIQISGPLLDMTTKSVRLVKELGQSDKFVNNLIVRLNSTTNAMVRKPSLKILTRIFQHLSSDKNEFIQKHQLQQVLQKATMDKSQVIVVEMASQLLKGINNLLQGQQR